MEKTSVKPKVFEIIIEQLGVSLNQVLLESKLILNLGADSLDMVELGMAFEEAFGLQDDTLDEIMEANPTVEEVVKFIESKV